MFTLCIYSMYQDYLRRDYNCIEGKVYIVISRKKSRIIKNFNNNDNNIHCPCAAGKHCSKHLPTQPHLILKIIQQGKYIIISISQIKKRRVRISQVPKTHSCRGEVRIRTQYIHCSMKQDEGEILCFAHIQSFLPPHAPWASVRWTHLVPNSRNQKEAGPPCWRKWHSHLSSISGLP